MHGDFTAIATEELFLKVQPKLHRVKKTGKVVAYRINNSGFPLRGAVWYPNRSSRRD